MVRLVTALVVLAGAALLAALPSPAPAQRGGSTPSPPCTRDIVMAIEGTYQRMPDSINLGRGQLILPAQRAEALRRLDPIHQLVVEAYPKPPGQRAHETRHISTWDFAPGVRTGSLEYESWYRYYACVNNALWGPAADNKTYVRVYVNDPGQLRGNRALGLTIDGQPMLAFWGVIGSWKGYDLHASAPWSDERYVLLTRKGESPYTPVTRRRWLAFLRTHMTRQLDEVIEGARRASSAGTDMTEAINRLTAGKAGTLRLIDETFAESQAQNLLDTPALVVSDSVLPGHPVFVPRGSDEAWMPVTANPGYIRKDVPPYVPQFMVLTWAWSDDTVATTLASGPQGRDFRRSFEANFAIDGLQALIDK